jgi:hypothetical protein
MDGLESMRLIHRQRPTIPIVISRRPLTPELTSEPDFLAMATKLGAIINPPKPFKSADPLAATEARIAGATQLSQDPGARP